MILMFDTNICIYAMNQSEGADRIWRRISGRSYGEIRISAISAAELRYGAENSAAKHQAANVEKLESFMEMFSVEDFPAGAMSDFARIRLSAKTIGKHPGAYDLLIAAHASYLGATLITNDSSDLEGLDGLRVENWLNN